MSLEDKLIMALIEEFQENPPPKSLSEMLEDVEGGTPWYPNLSTQMPPKELFKIIKGMLYDRPKGMEDPLKTYKTVEEMWEDGMSLEGLIYSLIPNYRHTLE